MCGISGILTTNRNIDGASLIARIVESQIPRGPDAQIIRDYHANNFTLILGHNRLSIIDLSQESNQPMTNLAGNLHVVFNGEIYNYLELKIELENAGAQFRTQSDTEVILEAYRIWGVKAFNRFIGMFSIALYDATAQELLLIRDRFGVKPLYYWSDAQSLAFASTPTVIAAWAGLKPNLDYVSRGIRYKYYEDETDISPYYNLASLEPSHFLRIQVANGKVSSSKYKYYDLLSNVTSTKASIAGRNEDSLQQEMLALLRSACSLRQRSDVPLGLSVSGGVDSSAIAAILFESLDNIIGYSFSSPDDTESEGPLVAELAKHTHLSPHYISPSSKQTIVELFWRTLKAQDAPFPHVSVMAQHAVFQAARASGTVVLLGGQGGDEAFMGYRKFYLFYALSILRELRITALPHFISAVLPFIPAVMKRASVFISERQRYTGAESGMGTRLALPQPSIFAHMGLPKGMSVEQRQILDVTRFSLPTLLRYEDRNSMGNSIESRLPFIDHRVMEFGIALSEHMKLGNGFGKTILRNSMAGKVPDSIRLNRDKRGFDVNQQRWISVGLGQALRDALNERKHSISQWLPTNKKIDTFFSDEVLINHPQAFKEAVSLIWLGDKG